MQNSTLLLHYSQSILSKMRVHGFLGKKNQNYAYLFCGNVDMLDSSKMEGKKNYTIGQNIAENGNNTILNDNIPLPNA